MTNSNVILVGQRLGTAIMFGGNLTNREAIINYLKIGGIELPVAYLSEADKGVVSDRIFFDYPTTEFLFYYEQVRAENSLFKRQHKEGIG